MKALRIRGFTLIELMITVAIVAILAAVAYPSYINYVRDSRRADCKGVLLSYANALERSFSLNNNYLDPDLDPTRNPPRFTCPSDGGAATYVLDLDVPAGDTFTLTATPTGSQTGDRCGELELTNSGRRDAEDNNCW